MGNLKIDVQKALETIAERKKGATIVRERVLHDLAAVYNESMTIREAIEFGFAMADSDADVAEHIDTITLGEVFGLAERQAQVLGSQSATKGRASSMVDSQVVVQTVEAIRSVLKEADEPLKIGDIRDLVEADERHFKAAWGSVKSELKKVGAGRATAWSSSLDA
jgi:hypothetical protein